MKKPSILHRILAFLLVVNCLFSGAAAEDLPPVTSQTEPYVVSDGPIANRDLAFGSVCILNGCRTVDGYVALGGSERRLESAHAAFAYERSTGTVVYAYNPDTKVSPGGLTKIVTALLAIEHCDMEDIVTVHSENISHLPSGVKHVDLKNYEELTVEDLVHCLIMQGANDAAIALAEHVAGNQEAFVAMMNQRVRQAGCTSTEFGNVHGLDNKPQHTTARDMCRIVMEATKNETFREVFSEVSYTVPETNRSKARKFESEHYFVDSKNIPKFYDKRVTSGMQTAAKGISDIVFTAKERNMDMVFVVMGCTRQMYDNGWQVKVYGNLEEGQALMKYVFNNFKTNRVLYYGQALKQFAVSGGEANVSVEPHLDLDSVLPSDAHMDNLILEYKDRGLKAPIKKDDIVATVEVWYRNTCLHEAELYAMEDVRLANKSGLKILGGADRSDGESRLSNYVLILSAVILIPVIGYLAINNILRLRRRAMTRKRRKAKERRYR